MIRWIKRILGLDKLEIEIAETRRMMEVKARDTDHRLSARLEELDRLTAMDADFGVRGPCTVIYTGVYRGRGYVKFVDVSASEFEYMIERDKAERRKSLVRHVDAPPMFLEKRGGSFKL